MLTFPGNNYRASRSHESVVCGWCAWSRARRQCNGIVATLPVAHGDTKMMLMECYGYLGGMLAVEDAEISMFIQNTESFRNQLKNSGGLC